MTRTQGPVTVGSAPSIEFTIRAPDYAPLVTSTAVTFTRIDPDGVTTIVTGPGGGITGPTAGTTIVDGVTVATTMWRWQMDTFTKPGTTYVRCRSTGGLLASIEHRIITPTYAPFETP